MMKNLKKVISAVAALALSASSFVAFAQQNFPDVASTANYAKAVDQLTALGIVTGYDDGTFGPEKLVTRAEMTAMIVRALGEESQAKSAANNNTAFSDVTGNHWAAGYVTVGVNAKPMFIQGMGDGIFAPDANVTFAQATTMLVRAAGYESRAGLSAWPTGYLSYGSQLGITTGVAGTVGNDEELNRGQVAILIDQTVVDAPLLLEDQLTTDVWGTPSWTYKQMNGEGKDYQTLLSYKHDAYKVYGSVTATKKTSSSSTLEADEVEFTITKADNFDDQFIGTSNSADAKSLKLNVVNVGDTDAVDKLNVYSEAIIAVDEDDNYTLISLSASGKSETKAFSADLVDPDNKWYTNKGQSMYESGVLYVFTDENQNKTTSYSLASSKNGAVSWYINGVDVTDSNYTAGIEEDKFNQYVIDNEVGEITLVDSTGITDNNMDGLYDSVMITYYDDAVVKSVSQSETNPRIYFDDYDATKLKSYLSLDLDDEDKVYSFKLGTPAESTAIELSDLQAYDVLSIAYDVTAGIADSDFVTVYVSRDVVDGSVSSINKTKGYKLGDEYYEAYEGLKPAKGGIETGSDYTFYLDVFGKIARIEEGTSSKLYGVLDNVYHATEGTYYVRLITADGTKQTYELNKQTDDEYKKVLGYMTDYNETNQAAGDDPVQYRVVNYAVNSKGYITIKGQVNPAVSASAEEDMYRLSTNRIGSVRLSENSVILDLIEYVSSKEDPAIMGSLTDEGRYTAFGYNKSATDSTYSFVIVTEGNAAINADSPIAIFVSSESTTDDGVDTIAVQLLVNGIEERMIADPDDEEVKDALGDMNVGDVFLFSQDSQDRIDKVEKVLTVDESYVAFKDRVFAADEETGKLNFNNMVEHEAVKGNTDKYLTKGSNTKGYFVFAPVMETMYNSIGLATLNADGKTDLSKNDVYSFESDAVVYLYDYNAGSGKNIEKRVDAASSGAFVETYVDAIANPNDGDIVDWNAVSADGAATEVKESANFALLKVVDNDVTEGYAIAPQD